MHTGGDDQRGASGAGSGENARDFTVTVTAQDGKYVAEGHGSEAAIAGASRNPNRGEPSTPTQERGLSTMEGAVGSSDASSASGCGEIRLSPPPVPAERPPYLAAGVLPFCVLGGDLLFLLGQQLRFRSRGRGSSFSEIEGALTSSDGVVAATNTTDTASCRPLRSGCNMEICVPPARRPRRGPRTKLSPPAPPWTADGPLIDDPSGSSCRLPPSSVVEASLEGIEQRVSPFTPLSSSALPSGIVGDTTPGGPPGAVSTSTARGTPQTEDTALLEATAVAGSSTPVAAAAGARQAGTNGDIGNYITKAESSKRGSPPPLNGWVLHDRGNTGVTVAPRRTVPIPAVEPFDAATAAVTTLTTASLKTEAYRQTPPVTRADSTVNEREKLEEKGITAGFCKQDIVPAGLLWSDFGGGREADDADAEETASREFAEESFGLFNGVRLQSDSVARSQATMATALRDPSLRGKRVFECRNGGYVMFIAEVDFVPDIMMKLARKEIVDGGEGGTGKDGKNDSDEVGNGTDSASTPASEGRASSLEGGFSEKTDFAWVPAASLLTAMRESRNRSTRRVVVRLGDCRYLRLFHKFVISLWRLDLASVVRAALTPLRRRTPAPRVLLLKFNTGGSRKEAEKRAAMTTSRTGGRCAIRGIDCIRPSFLSGRKRTSLGIIDQQQYGGRGSPAARRFVSGGGRSRRCGRGGKEKGEDAGSGAGMEAGGSKAMGVVTDSASRDQAEPRSTPTGGGLRRDNHDGGFGGNGVNPSEGHGSGSVRSRCKKSGAACRKIRRQRKEARRIRAVAAAAAATAAAAAVTSKPAENP